MKLLISLIMREAWYHRMRISLAVLAIVAMSCMIIWLIGSLDLMILRFDQDAENYLGHYQLALIPDRDVELSSILDEMRADKIVVQISPSRQIRNTMGKMKDEHDNDAALRRQRAGTGIPMQSPLLVGIDCEESPFELEEGRWFFDDELPEGVMGTAAAQSLMEWGADDASPVRIGDAVICRIENNEFKIIIVGLVEQKLTSAGFGGPGRSFDVTPAVGALYISLKNANRISATSNASADLYYVRLRDGADSKAFKEHWTKRFESDKISSSFLDVDDIQEKLNTPRSGGPAGLMGNAASMNSVIIFTSIVSALIVFTTLSMGVSERSRVFAMLRTLGMPRRQIAILVFGESVILCLLGWIGGMIAGWFVLQLTVWLDPEVYGHGKLVSLGQTTVLTAGIAVLVGSLCAAAIPAWRAMCINPLEGMNRGFMQTFHRGWLVLFGVIGVVLLCINPILVYTEDISKTAELRMFLYVWIGLPTQLVGCVLLVPAMILLVEKFMAPPVARLLMIPKELLASQLSSNLCRTLGTTIALSIGLGVYSFLEISGYSMLVPYVQSKTLPNTLIAFLPDGIPLDKISEVQNLPGVDSKRFLPIALDQSVFSRSQTERFVNNGLIPMQASAVVFGIDIAKAFEKMDNNNRPLIEVGFVEGNLESALEKLITGKRYCLIPDSFAFRADIHVGDKLQLVLPDNESPPGNRRQGRRGGISTIEDAAEKIVEYEVCGVVTINGWLWMNKISGVRKRGYRSGAMLIAPYDVVKEDYKLNDAAYFWFDRTKDAAGKPTVSDIKLENSLQKIAEKYSVGPNRPMVKVSSREYLADRVGDRADEVIQAAAKIPLILLAISSFGMMGTVAASIRNRRFELGVLRSLGVTRFGLIRLILAEAVLISIAAIVMSVGFGIIGGWCFIGLMQYVYSFGGFVSPLTIPVYWLSIGLCTVLGFCMIAALIPAITAGRSEPTALLRDN